MRGASTTDRPPMGGIGFLSTKNASALPVSSLDQTMPLRPLAIATDQRLIWLKRQSINSEITKTRIDLPCRPFYTPLYCLREKHCTIRIDAGCQPGVNPALLLCAIGHQELTHVLQDYPHPS